MELGAKASFQELVRYAKEKLPNSPGVYYFKSAENKILYVGKSIRICERILQHIQAAKSEVREARLCYLTTHIDFVLTGTELIALLFESGEIKKHLPHFNRAQRKSRALWGWRLGESSKKYFDIIPERITEQVSWIEENPFVREFLSYRTAENFREKILKENGFCLSPGSGRPCFWYQIDICKGACCGVEGFETYNQRLREKINATLPRLLSDQLIVGRGREAREKSFVVVSDGIFQGYGYVPASQIKNPQALERALVNCTHNSDIQRILRAYLSEKDRKFFKQFAEPTPGQVGSGSVYSAST